MNMNDKPAVFSNERTIASAGAGKTYALTNRFIALSRICPPESICALTFTRMAAGEFLDKILTKLARAVLDKKYAQDLSKEIAALSGTPVGEDDFLPLLKKIIEVLPRLNLSTIDAFEVRFASAFASELGLAGRTRMMDDFAIERAKKLVLKKVLSRFASQENLFKSFATAVNVANGGKLEKEVFKSIMNFVKASQKLYRDFPDVSRWGNEKLLKNSEPIMSVWDGDEYSAALAELLATDSPANKFLPHIKTFFKNSSVCNIYKSSSKGVKWLREYARERFAPKPLKRSIEPEVFIDAADFTARELSLIDNLLRLLIGGTLHVMSQTAAAIGGIVAAYDRVYSEEVRLRGNLSFEDLPILLTDSRLSFERKLVEYRLDSRFNHWLLDEFQDTSRIQWKVLSNLIEEVLDDDSNMRTMYYVGDRKQSIYGWRDGDPELFDDIFNSHRDVIREGAPLNVSRRSSTPVIEVVNRVFSSAMLGEFGDAAEVWERMWTEHSSHKSCGENGCAMFVAQQKSEDKIDAIYDILKEINPDARGLSCAILVHRNGLVSEIIEGLRARAKSDKFNLTVAGEIDCAIADDNMPVPALLALIKGAAHPLDTASIAYVRMTPVGKFTEGENWDTEILAEIFEFGFEKFFSRRLSRLNEMGFCNDEFSKQRVLNLIDAAGEFDSEFAPDVDDFIEFANQYSVRESSKQSAVQVMTVHKSKGLDFDFVILPQLENLNKPVSSLRLRRVPADDGGEVVMNLPAQQTCEFSTNLLNSYNDWKRAEMVESICKFYVAVTRAKRGLYFIGAPVDAAKKDTSLYSFEKHMARLAQTCETVSFANRECAVLSGKADWYLQLQSRGDIMSNAGGIPTLQSPKLAPLPRAQLSPSIASALQASKNFSYCANISDKGKEFGTLVHEILEEMTDADAIKNLSDSISRRRKIFDFPLLDTVGRVLEKCLANPDIARIFTDAKIFRNEYPFSVATDDGVLNGVFDRINMEKSTDGKIWRVEIIDYKTDLLERCADELLSIYSHQMLFYSNAAMKLFGLEKSAVVVRIVSVNSATISKPL